MITPAYSVTATERVLPRMALDFTTGTLDPRVTVARALNTATRVNSSGLIEVVNANLPRFDYSPATLAPKGLLIEEARTNLTLGSSDMANATYWTTLRASWPNTTIVAPDGTNTGQKLVEDTSASNSHLGLTVTNTTTVASTTYTTSIYAKAGERSWFQLGEGQTMTAAAYFDLANGVVGTVSGTGTPSATITPAGNGWYRCTLTFTTTGTAARIRLYLATANGTATYTGNGTSGAYFWGAQLEAGAFATSYIPTTTTSLTRNADVVSMTGTNFSSWFNQSEGAFVTEADTVNPFSRWFYTVNDGSSTNYIGSDFNSSANVRFRVVNTGASQASVTSVAAVSANTIIKHAAAYATNSFNQALNGVLNTTDTTGSFVAMSQLQFSAANANPNLNGHIRSFRYYPQRLTNAELQAFST